MNYVIGTIRENPNNPKSAIIALVLDRFLNGSNFHGLKAIKHLADCNLLEVKLNAFYSTKVQIYYSAVLERYIARTDSDTTTCNNLELLPVYQAPAVTTGVSRYY